MIVPNRPGLGVTLSDRTAEWTKERASFGKGA
jgi:hypothetical protein